MTLNNSMWTLMLNQYLLDSSSYQLVKVDLWAIFSSNKPPGSGTNGGGTHITW